MIGYEILTMESHGEAVTAEVKFERADGTVRRNRYSWPIRTTPEEIRSILAVFFKQFAEEAAIPVAAPLLAMQGERRDLSGLDPMVPVLAAAAAAKATPAPGPPVAAPASAAPL